jgi:shikimate dehydrogenase
VGRAETAGTVGRMGGMPRFEQIEPVPEGHLGIAVLGEGADASLVPELQRAALAEMDVPATVVKVETRVEELNDGLQRLKELGYRGVNVGNPFKAAAARLAAHFYVVKHSLGAANALMLGDGIYAQNTEVTAFQRTLEGVKPATALVLGSGHAARSVAMALLETGWKVKIWSRSALKARPLLTLLQRHGPIELVPNPDPIGCALIVNATPLGLRIGELPPLNFNHIQRGAIVYDLVFRRVKTELVRAAALRGVRTIDGRAMVVEQAAQALEWWTGKPVPREAMTAANRGSR